MNQNPERKSRADGSVKNKQPTNAMKAYVRREVSLLRRMVMSSLVFVLCMVGTVSYNVLGARQLFQTRSYRVAQLSADARTVAAALYFLLEVEPPDLDTSTPRSLRVG